MSLRIPHITSMIDKTSIDHSYVIESLARNRDVFLGLLDGLTAEETSWKPQPQKWSLLEIVCHLYDEEREDFRTRVQHTLTSPTTDAPPIDPEGWVISRKYSEQDYHEMLQRFLHEREQSVDWLRSLQSPPWDSTYVHPKYGPMSAEFFLINWLAHDMLHIRQILRVRYHYLAQSTSESLLYAGEW